MRSDVIKKGAPAAPNRSLLYALGYTKEELERLYGVKVLACQADGGVEHLS